MTAIFGIINTSPDSFSGDGVSSKAAIRRRLETALADGADVLDIGGQSTRPGAPEVSVAEEIARTIPAISVARSLTDQPISIDTFKPAVAEAAIAAGATIVNDVHGCSDPAMIELIARHAVKVVVMHSRGDASNMTQLTNYPDGLVQELLAFFGERIAHLQAAGVPQENIIIDPGIGFAKTPAQSFLATRALPELRQLGLPILYAASRKSFLGKALARGDEPRPIDQREAGTDATTAFAMMCQADYVRVHDVKAAADIRRVLACIAKPELADD